ncbi:Zinc finger, C3HC-like [Dillenia turbinata]|uniref:Zinc finger, C3HC-like n=1 Tax=Dillenia turbinata TaxID=194707 RepID=A0AAN8V0I5_9MAGN
MAEDPEKRFHSIMDKLFSSPKPIQSSLEVESSRGQKRSLAGVAKSSSKSEGSSASPTPVCRPWHRGDLMTRLATFKSMTWFAKPKAVSAVNCARRGWVNVDTDTIACEACGARLFFSTPSSWPQHQVEKAALVFSLKLDNGHKLLCPWIDNTCDEALAQFPPTPAPLLVDGYRDRASKLLQLSALPIISSSAIDLMQSPQLEMFLSQSSLPEFGNICTDASRSEYLGNECEAHDATLYDQAQKLISLCGWEPRALPYIVESQDQANKSTEDVHRPNSPHLWANEQHSSICIYSCSTDENIEANEDTAFSDGLKFENSSVVLDCNLCGASVGLWAFSTVNRPLELFKLVGYSEGNSQNGSADGAEKVALSGASVTQDLGIANHVTAVDGTSKPVSDSAKSSTAKLLSLTIAGGPPPAKQNFRAMIALPIIGQNLRARFSLDSDFRKHILSSKPCDAQENSQSDPPNKDIVQEDCICTENALPEKFDQPESNNASASQGKNDGSNGSTTDDQFQELNDTDETGDVPRDTYPEEDKESRQHVLQGSGQNEKLSEMLSADSTNESTLQTPGSDMVEYRVDDSASHHISSSVASSLEANESIIQKVDLRKRKDHSDVRDITHEINGIPGQLQSPAVNPHKAMEFDPIKQHRHFCPWITSTSTAAPGWQQTLSALQRHYHPSPSNSPSLSVIKVDDPITSIRRLFMSPSAKRAKHTPESQRKS